jgi:D-beta-D-heptose 7-phosphate kinase/D-beta-D-heptose 1-phosphate adenosyltransferase
MDLINEFSNRLQENKRSIFIHVIGDSMLDQDYRVNTNRISPECPNVNVLQSPDDKPFRQFPGGAANVCYQLSNFNVICRLFSFIDEEAYQIIRDKGVKYWGLVGLPHGYFVPRKKRFYAQGFQVVSRWDIERTNYGIEFLGNLQSELLDTWQVFQAEPDVIIFSDYDKGVFNNFSISRIKTNAITIVDPKAAPLERWKGCTVFKPNSKEARDLSGKQDWKSQCEYFQQVLGCKVVIITQAGDGIVGKTDDYFEYRPKLNITPVDIVGAGDCFAGILALAMAMGFNAEQSAMIAFHGGILCVQQKERGSFGPWSFGNKIVKNVDFLKDRNYKLIFTNGVFDLLHTSHINMLKFAKAQGDKLIVALNSDASVKRLKGESRPIIPLKNRMEVIAALECVDYVTSFEEDTPLELVKRLNPIMVKGGDYRKEDIAGYEVVGQDNIILYPYEQGNSTSRIIQQMNSE